MTSYLIMIRIIIVILSRDCSRLSFKEIWQTKESKVIRTTVSDQLNSDVNIRKFNSRNFWNIAYVILVIYLISSSHSVIVPELSRMK